MKIKNYKVPQNSEYGTLVKSLTSVRFKINCIWFLYVGCDAGRLEVRDCSFRNLDYGTYTRNMSYRRIIVGREVLNFLNIVVLYVVLMLNVSFGLGFGFGFNIYGIYVHNRNSYQNNIFTDTMSIHYWLPKSRSRLIDVVLCT